MAARRSLRKGEEFDTAYRQGTVVSGPLLVIRHRQTGSGDVRWGFAVGKRLAKRAVDRNRVKRRLVDIFRRIAIVPGTDIVVVARAGSVEASYAELQRCLEAGLRRAGVVEREGGA
ncbi:MAG: ribonuclease P protein component [Chloroflexi bacterium]|nr:ribonuclease P protein component [Chloroflexota bacterium]